MFSVKVDNYEVTLDDTGKLTATRNGKPWRELSGDNLILALAQEVDTLRAVIKTLRAGMETLRSENADQHNHTIDLQRELDRSKNEYEALHAKYTSDVQRLKSLLSPTTEDACLDCRHPRSVHSVGGCMHKGGDNQMCMCMWSNDDI